MFAEQFFSYVQLHRTTEYRDLLYYLALFFQFGSYPLAISFQEKVVEGWEGHGQSAQDELDEAVRVLAQLKEKASAQISQALLDAMPSLEENPESANSAIER